MAKSTKTSRINNLIAELTELDSDELISLLREDKIIAMVMKAADKHVETIKEGSAIKKTVFTESWSKRTDTQHGWHRTSQAGRGSDKVNVTVYYKDGSVQKHVIPNGEKVEYRDGQYFFPNAGTLTPAN